MVTKIALAGNPNCGKTTLFNDLTGSAQYVGNWPGVTVEKKDGVLLGHKKVVIQDLPGIYSLSPYSLEEVVARNYLVNERPDAILNIVDGSNLERNLYLTTQLLELGIPMVVAVNMIDVVRKNGDRIDLAKLSKELGCAVVEISALKGEGTKKAADMAIEAAEKGIQGERPHVFTGSVEHAIAHIEESLHGKVEKATSRWAAIKVFERDAKAIETLSVPADIVSHVEGHIKDCEKEMEDDSESIITTQRYEYIQRIVADTYRRSPRRASTTLSDKIDKVVTNRILALPIFILSLCAMWWLAVADGGPGTTLTDWANDGFLGDGWHLPFTTHEVDGKDYETACEDFAKAEATVKAWEAGEKKASIEDEETGEMAEEWDVDETAYKAAKETLSPLLGQAPDPELVQEIRDIVMAHDTVQGVHDLVVHDYGPGRCMISLHAEVPAHGDIMEMHDVIDNIEKELAEQLHCQAVIHMDPIVTDDASVGALRRQIAEVAKQVDPHMTIHDFRMVQGTTHTNLIFDAVLPFSSGKTPSQTAQAIRELVRAMDGNYYAVVTVEHSFTE